MSGPSGTVKGAKAKGCKIAFSSDGRTLDSKISRSLARAPYFIIAEGSPDNRTVIENPGKGKGSEGGEMAARALVKERVDTVVTSNIGPKAAKVLEDAHITVHAGCRGTISEAIEKCLAGKLVATRGASYSGCLESPGTAKADQ
jgi:predicted Fe-Mo cluster-binding NifX family protein